MREIKFRAWEKSLKQMIPVRSIYFERRMINTGSAWRMLDEIQLMQYTGLNDTNGKEIYEGDIVSYYGKAMGIVQFENGRYEMKFIIPKKKYTTGISGKYNLSAISVIGNIYENPELLEVGHE